MRREVPPTSGLPLRWSDLLPLSNRGLGTGVESPASGLEAALAAFLKVEHVQIECSGTAALVLLLSYLKAKVPERDLVVLPAYTCPLVAIAVAQAGLRVYLCDNIAGKFDFDRRQLEQICTELKPLAIIPTHFAGFAADVESLLPIARQYGSFVIEDAAQSLGATHRGVHAGLFGDFGVFSLSLGKGLTIYQGGFWTAADASMKNEILALRRDLVKPDPPLELLRIIQLIAYRTLYTPTALHFSYGRSLKESIARQDYATAVGDVFPLRTELSEVSVYRKLVGLESMKRLPAHIATNRARGRRRAAQLNALDGLTVLDEAADSAGSWPFLTVIFNQEEACRRSLKILWTAGVGITKLFVNALPDYEYLRHITAFPGAQPVPHAVSLASRMMTISNSAWLTDEDFGFIYSTLARLLDPNSLAAMPALKGVNPARQREGGTERAPAPPPDKINPLINEKLS